jgi:hypothetical protein
MIGNQSTLEKGMAKATAVFRQRVLSALKKTAFDLSELTDVPIWTHNLWDSVGVGIYENGTLVEYAVPARQATEPRSGADDFPMEARQWSGSEAPLWDVPSGVDVDRAWWGQAELFDMLADPPASILASSGYALYYVAAMPYAQIVDDTQEVLHEQMVRPLFFKHIKLNAR